MKINLNTEANKVDKKIIIHLSKIGLSEDDFDTNFTILWKDRPDIAIKKDWKYSIIFENKRTFTDLEKAKIQWLSYIHQLNSLWYINDKFLLITTNWLSFFCDQFILDDNEIKWLEEVQINSLESITLDFIKYNTTITNEQEKLLKTDKKELKRIFDKINNYLRDKWLWISERLHITSAMIFLKMVKENSDVFDFNRNELSKNQLNVKFKNLELNINEYNIIDIFNTINSFYKWDFNFNISEYEWKNIIEWLFSIIDEANLSWYDLDIKWEAFEYFINYWNANSDMGEYFTPRHVIKFIVNLLDEEFIKNRTFMFWKKYFDPTCWTWWFLIEIFKKIKNELKENNKLNNNILELKTNTVFWNELNLRSAEISKMNMILTWDWHSNISQWDFLDIYKNKKEFFDVAIWNPPFGKKREPEFLRCFIESIKEWWYIILVLPDWILWNEWWNNKSFVNIRKHLLNKGKVLKIISLPQGIFLPYAVSKTNIIFWKKSKQSTNYDIEFLNIKTDWYSLDTKRDFIWDSDLDLYFSNKSKLIKEWKIFNVNTKDIWNLDILNTLELKKSKLITENKKNTIDLNELKKWLLDNNIDNKEILFIKWKILKINNTIKLNNKNLKEIESQINWFGFNMMVNKFDNSLKITSHHNTRKISEIFNIEKGNLQSTKAIDWKYNFITASEQWSKHESYKYDWEALIFVMWASWSLWRTHYVNWKFIASDLCFILTPKEWEKVNLKFYYYYFNKIRKNIVKALVKWWAKLTIWKNDFSKFKIIYPQYEEQLEFAKQIIKNESKIDNYKKKIIYEEKNIIDRFNHLVG